MKINKRISHIFERIGLTEADALVYISLLKLTEALPTDIARDTDLYRPVVYRSLLSLSEKQLIRLASKGKRTTYIPESPERLEKLFKELEQSFFNDIEDLHQLYNTSKTKLTVSMAEGEEAIRNAYSDVVDSLEKNDTYYRYSSIKQFLRTKFIPKDYEAIRDRKGLERLVITGAKNVSHKKLLGRTVRTIPAEYDLFQDEINVIIYKDKVSIIDYPSKSTMTIKHQTFANFQKKIFIL